MAFDDPRDFLAFLEEKGDLARVSTPVDPKYEIAAYIRKTSDEQGPAVLFERVKGHDIPVVGGVFAARRRILWALGYPPGEEHEHFHHGLTHPIDPVPVEHGPCQENVFTGENVDLTRLPVPTCCLEDGGPYVTLGIVISRDPETGGKNAGIYRLQLKGLNRLGVFASFHQHLAYHITRAEERGVALEIAVALGVDPVIVLASQIKERYGADELGVAGGLNGRPVETVRCRTVDLDVPAASEIVIEGRLLLHHREEEGPFGEVSGYYGPRSERPVMEVTAVTHRNDPVFYAGLTGMPSTDNHFLVQIPYEVAVYRELKAKFPEVKAVHFPASGCGIYNCYISMTPRYKGQARNVLLAALGSARRPKLVVVVDEDIDIHDDVKVLWAVTTRVQADRDVIIMPSVGSAPLDPSTPEPGLSSVMGIDATRPFGRDFPSVPLVPGVEKVPDLSALIRGRGKVSS